MFKTMNRVVLGMLGFTGGVMVAASFEFISTMKETGGEASKVMPASFPWCLVYFGIDKVLPHLHINFKVRRN
jgi:ZIP family zinc transporter